MTDERIEHAAERAIYGVPAEEKDVLFRGFCSGAEWARQESAIISESESILGEVFASFDLQSLTTEQRVLVTIVIARVSLFISKNIRGEF